MAREILSGKSAVITGGARGIGYAITKYLLREGVAVAFCALHQHTVDEAVASLAPLGKVLGLAADISRLEDVRGFISAANQFLGGVDILVNSAAIRTYTSVMSLEPAEWERMIAVNLTGAYYCIHEVLPLMKERGSGDIVNISSLSSTTPFAGGAGYNASKSGLNGLSGATMLDHRYDGIRVSEVLPGSTDTDFSQSGSKQDGTRMDWKVAPEDIADAVVFLLQMPRHTTVSRVDIKPSKPPRKQ